jgi:hypothetical protein
MTKLSITHTGRRAVAEDLAKFLVSEGYTVNSITRDKKDHEDTHPPPDGLARLRDLFEKNRAKNQREVRTAVPFIEVLGIFIGSGMATALLGNITTDLYNAVKKWGDKKNSRSEITEFVRINIYGPDGKEVASVSYSVIPQEILDALRDQREP